MGRLAFLFPFWGTTVFCALPRLNTLINHDVTELFACIFTETIVMERKGMPYENAAPVHRTTTTRFICKPFYSSLRVRIQCTWKYLTCRCRMQSLGDELFVHSLNHRITVTALSYPQANGTFNPTDFPMQIIKTSFFFCLDLDHCFIFHLWL